MSMVLLATMSYPWWTKIGSPLADHLWQSTLFAAIAGLVTLFLAKNHASTRYAIWVIASLKFLIPFYLFMMVGSQFQWVRHSAASPVQVVAVIRSFSEPFATVNTASHVVSAKTEVHVLVARTLPMMLLVVWGGGFVSVLAYWWYRMRGITLVTRDAKSLQEGREFNALCRARGALNEHRRIRVALSKSVLEPGILGIFHPVLLLPAGISERLTDAQLEAIMIHELCHVRRRDNLAAALHMLVEAVFWFHPLVWWIGGRLVDERERACDEEVLRLGKDPQTYAESILKICEFYMESPLLCASGVTGSNLKKRIEVIMQNRAPMNLNFPRKLLLGSAGLLVVAVPLIFGLLHTTQTDAESRGTSSIKGAFDSVYLQPNTNGEPMPPFKVYGRPMKAVQFKDGTNFLATNFSLRDLIKVAFQVQSLQILGGPDWLDSEKYDVDAKVTGAESEKIQHLNPQEKTEQMRTRIQALLADRFKLAVHRATETVPVYALVLAQDGSQLHPAKPGDTYNDGPKDPTGRPLGPGTLLFPESNKLVAQAIPLKSLTDWLGRQELGRMVVEKTGLTEKYDITLQLPPKQTDYWSVGALTEALEQQLGLKLEAHDDPVEVLVVDHAQKPSEIESHAEASGQAAPSRAQSPEPNATSFPVLTNVYVKQNNSGSKISSMNVPLGYGDIFPDTQGAFSGVNVPLVSYIVFAYDLTGSQLQLLLPQLPKWTVQDHFDIQAQSGRNLTREQMRLVVQSLLSDRFKLTTHYESRQLPVFTLVMANPRVTGPRLRPHADNPPCLPPPAGPDWTSSLRAMPTSGEGFPSVCGGIVGLPSQEPGRMRVGARRVPIGLFVNTLAQVGNLDRPVLDRSGLAGTFDFVFDWTPQLNDESKPGFLHDLKEQLGLELQSEVGTAKVFVVDHLEKPSEN